MVEGGWLVLVTKAEANVTRPEHPESIVKQILIKLLETRHEKAPVCPKNKNATT
jgi:hypothetical protein